MTALFTHVGWVWVLAALGTTIVAHYAGSVTHLAPGPPASGPASRRRRVARVVPGRGRGCAAGLDGRRRWAGAGVTGSDDVRDPSPSPAETPSSGRSPTRQRKHADGQCGGSRRWRNLDVRCGADDRTPPRRVGRGSKARPQRTPRRVASMQGDLARLQAVMGVGVPVRLLESSQVDVPIVVGCRPVLILPPDIQGQRSLETLEPLLAHELAHVVRRDYLMNMLQSGADAVLFAFPAARWISARVRETREYLLRRDGVAGLRRHATVRRGAGWHRDAQRRAATGGGAWCGWTASGHTHTAPPPRRP